MEVFSLVAASLEHLYKRPLEMEASAAREEIVFLLGTCPFPQGATAAETAALLEKVCSYRTGFPVIAYLRIDVMFA